jgi:hypothetical protein
MATLRVVLQRIWSLPDSEAPEWLLTAKRSKRTAESIEAEIRSAGIRIHQSGASVVRTAPAPAPVLSAASVDAENRRRLLALGREVYSDKSFRDSISAKLSERAQHQTRLEDIRNLGRAILGNE